MARLIKWSALSCVGIFTYIHLLSFTEDHINHEESYYLNPVGPKLSIALRNDEMGKGFFGASRDPDRLHEGIDLASSMEDPVFAAKSGRISFAGLKGGYGNFVSIRHPDGLSSHYAHLSEFYVTAGQWVKSQEIIGRVGKSGNAKDPRIEPHVHFEIRKGDMPLDPIGYINKS